MLTKKGRKLKGEFEAEYGKKRGDKLFYAYEHKHPEFKLKR